MKLLSIIKALGSVCLLCVDGAPVSEDESPEIIGPSHVQIKAHPGEPLLLHCSAFTNCEDDASLIYWLVNDTFPEESLSSDRIVESSESSLEEGAVLQRSLLLKTVTSEDLKSNFTCVVTNAMGMAQKCITLTAKTDGSYCN
ncbi:interleukin-1 receptor type 2-like [Acanthochromis polyacanthus]|uniref:interleukin-1 receptor type 2-like n=1 Tax=Acanthochromis polyacanthus TaxID=80966 RepID=UPI000B8F5D82|nr:interleukin-1 receptor type 2-like [Acanthochromis polyacanthus]